MVDRDELVVLSRSLAEVPSHTDEGEREAGDRVEEWLRDQTSADVERGDHGNVFARRTTDRDGPTLALVGHHDIVAPADRQWAREVSASGSRSETAASTAAAPRT